jgi:hypothetical protein
MIWNNDTPTILYGAAYMGTLVYKILQGEANIIAFADRRADEIKNYLGYPVWAPDSGSFNDAIKASAVVIICVKNIFEHETIAQYLANNGFLHVVFCPVDGSSHAYRSDDERNALTRLYHALTEGGFSLPCQVPPMQGLFSQCYSDTTVINKKDGTVTVYIPTVFCYTRQNRGDMLRDIPIMSLFPYFELFGYFDGELGKNYKNYLDFVKLLAEESGTYERTERWAANVIDNRRMVYERMNFSGGLDADFFVDRAVTADWNQSGGYFNLNSGKHRAAYLIHQKIIYIPLKITELDYESYLNQTVVMEITEYLIRENAMELPYPVWHPYLANIPYCPNSNFYNIFCKFAQWLSKNLYRDRDKIGYYGISVLDDTDILVPFSRCLSKLGCAVERSKSANTFDLLVDKLYHVNIGPQTNQKYDVVIAYGENIEQWRSRAGYGLFLLPTESDCANLAFDAMGRCFAKGHEFVCAAGRMGQNAN